MKRGDAPQPVSVDLTGAKTLVLAVVDANDGTAGDNADWAGAAIVTAPGAAGADPASPRRRVEAPPPIAPSRIAAPMINYPRITGATPGRPFLFRIPASGDGAADLHGAEPSRRPDARREDRHHHRLAEARRAHRAWRSR